MKELREYYHRRLIGLAVACVAYSVASQIVVEKYVAIQSGNLKIAAQVFTSQYVIVLLMSLGELFIRKVLWRIERRDLDFSGDWFGETTFKYCSDPGVPIPGPSTYKVRFEQDCTRFQLAPTEGELMNSWGSLAIELVDKDMVRYAYWVRYADRNRFPEEAIGFEELQVVERDWLGRPIAINGAFWHCDRSDSIPQFRGSVKFSRSKPGKASTEEGASQDLNAVSKHVNKKNRRKKN